MTPDEAMAYIVRSGYTEDRLGVKVRKYREAMARGEWDMDGPPVIVGNDGRVRDGLHRICAIAGLDEPFDIPVVVCDDPKTVRAHVNAAARSIVGRYGYRKAGGHCGKY